MKPRNKYADVTDFQFIAICCQKSSYWHIIYIYLKSVFVLLEYTSKHS